MGEIKWQFIPLLSPLRLIETRFTQCCLASNFTDAGLLHKIRVSNFICKWHELSGCKIIEGIEANCLEAPTSCLDALEFSLLFCYSFTCSCLLKLMCPLKIALKCLPFKILILHPMNYITNVFLSTLINRSIDILLEFWRFCQSSEHRFPPCLHGSFL